MLINVQNNVALRRSDGSILPGLPITSSGSDSLGSFTSVETQWQPFSTYFSTSYRTYSSGDVVVFTQSFSNPQDIEGADVATVLDRALNDVSTSYPSLVVNIDNNDKGFWSYGGRMAGTPCISIGRLENSTWSIRDGNFGGPLLFFNEMGNEVVIMSPLTNFLVSNFAHRKNGNPDLEHHPGVLDFGLMGSIRTIPAPGLDLEMVMVFGNSFDQAFQRWGQVLTTYSGKSVDIQAPSLVADYIGTQPNLGTLFTVTLSIIIRLLDRQWSLLLLQNHGLVKLRGYHHQCQIHFELLGHSSCLLGD